jgi:hypothetical protein
MLTVLVATTTSLKVRRIYRVIYHDQTPSLSSGGVSFRHPSLTLRMTGSAQDDEMRSCRFSEVVANVILG